MTCGPSKVQIMRCDFKGNTRDAMITSFNTAFNYTVNLEVLQR